MYPGTSTHLGDGLVVDRRHVLQELAVLHVPQAQLPVVIQPRRPHLENREGSTISRPMMLRYRLIAHYKWAGMNGQQSQKSTCLRVDGEHDEGVVVAAADGLDARGQRPVAELHRPLLFI